MVDGENAHCLIVNSDMSTDEDTTASLPLRPSTTQLTARSKWHTGVHVLGRPLMATYMCLTAAQVTMSHRAFPCISYCLFGVHIAINSSMV
jgi:hypothetical protein